MASVLTQPVRFAGSRGQKLAGTLTTPGAQPPVAWALFAHCFTCHRNYKVISYIARRLAARGLGSLRFDFTGLGESSGHFEDTNLTTNIEDVLSAARFLAENHGAARLLLGHSLGAAAMFGAGLELPDARCLVTISAPFEPQNTLQLVESSVEAMLAEPERIFQVPVMGRPMPFKAQFGLDLRRHDVPATIARWRRPLLICHSPIDAITPWGQAEKIYQTAAQPKSLLSLGDTDHLVSSRAAAEWLGDLIAAWSMRYLG